MCPIEVEVLFNRCHVEIGRDYFQLDSPHFSKRRVPSLGGTLYTILLQNSNTFLLYRYNFLIFLFIIFCL